MEPPQVCAYVRTCVQKCVQAHLQLLGRAAPQEWFPGAQWMSAHKDRRALCPHCLLRSQHLGPQWLLGEKPLLSTRANACVRPQTTEMIAVTPSHSDVHVTDTRQMYFLTALVGISVDMQVTG